MFGTVTKGLIQGLDNWEIGIVEIDQNTKKSPGDLRRHAVAQTLFENHQLNSLKQNNMRISLSQ